MPHKKLLDVSLDSQLHLANRLRVANDRIAELEQELRIAKAQTVAVMKESESENQRLRDALLSFKKQYPLSPWIHNVVSKALEDSNAG